MDPWDVNWEEDYYAAVNDHILSHDVGVTASMGNHAGSDHHDDANASMCKHAGNEHHHSDTDHDNDTDDMPHLTDESDNEGERKPPSMPCRRIKKRYAKHRAKLAAKSRFNACVAWPVGKK